MASAGDLTSLLAALASAHVDFVLVGGLAAVAQGAPVTTHDVDIVHSRTPENLDHLLAVLARLNARHRGRPPSSPLAPDRSALASPGHSLLVTDLGPLDCLGTIESGLAYDDLLPHTVELSVAGNPVRVLALAMIVMLKRKSTHPKDRLVLPILEETLRRLGQP